MSRYVYLALLAVLVSLIFAPAAVAQRMDDHQMRGEQERMHDNAMSASPMSSASASPMSNASASSMSSASASPMSSASASASPMSSATASASSMSSASAMSAGHSATASSLPRTGGMPLLPLLSAAALALIAGSGIVAVAMVRRSS